MDRVVALISLLTLTSCFRVGDELEPQLNYGVQESYLKALPSPFPELTSHELSQDWGREDKIALGFAHELDLYQAITGFKRASFLIPPHYTDRRLQIDYDTLLCYYLGGKYVETVYTFERSSLQTTTPTFTPFHDQLVILYDSYMKQSQPEHADKILHYMESLYPQTAQKLATSKLLMKGDIDGLQQIGSTDPTIASLLHQYDLEKKSTQKAQLYNALLPGAGYLYLGQKQSALTAFFLNGLFIWASVYFFHHGNTAAGIIFSSIEAGWYFGGIYGAGLEAKFYNERVFERNATPMMNEKGYFPILMLNYGF